MLVGGDRDKNEKKLIEAHGLVSMLDRFSSARDSGNGAPKSAVMFGETKLSNGRRGE